MKGGMLTQEAVLGAGEPIAGGVSHLGQVLVKRLTPAKHDQLIAMQAVESPEMIKWKEDRRVKVDQAQEAEQEQAEQAAQAAQDAEQGSVSSTKRSLRKTTEVTGIGVDLLLDLVADGRGNAFDTLWHEEKWSYKSKDKFLCKYDIHGIPMTANDLISKGGAMTEAEAMAVFERSRKELKAGEKWEDELLKKQEVECQEYMSDAGRCLFANNTVFAHVSGKERMILFAGDAVLLEDTSKSRANLYKEKIKELKEYAEMEMEISDILKINIAKFLSVTPIQDLLMQTCNNPPYPAYQTKYNIIFKPSGVYVITYTFIGDDVKGSRPDQKYTTNILRSVTGDLSKENVSGFTYFVTETNVEQTQVFINEEIPGILSGSNLEQIIDEAPRFRVLMDNFNPTEGSVTQKPHRRQGNAGMEQLKRKVSPSHKIRSQNQFVEGDVFGKIGYTAAAKKAEEGLEYDLETFEEYMDSMAAKEAAAEEGYRATMSKLKGSAQLENPKNSRASLEYDFETFEEYMDSIAVKRLGPEKAILAGRGAAGTRIINQVDELVGRIEHATTKERCTELRSDLLRIRNQLNEDRFPEYINFLKGKISKLDTEIENFGTGWNKVGTGRFLRISGPMRAVKVWLDNNGLGMFVEKFNAEGYDDMQALFEMEEQEVDELIIEMKMDKGDEDKFRAMITDLKKKDVIQLTDGDRHHI